MKLYRVFLLILISLSVSVAMTQPFSDEIGQFKKQDSIRFPPKDAILFVGSSSFRFWQDVSNYFPGYTIINRGFGGSSLPDVIRYADEIIFPYQPRQIVIYCGENDLAGADTVTGKTVFERFKTLFELIRSKMPGEDIVFVSLKPSPSRENLLPKMEEANLLIKTYLSIQTHAHFVDVYHKMLNADGTLRKDLYRDDMLHMRPKGYAIWQKEIAPYLFK
ncbi:MAG: GDSL-type esterase/lipase family protein [Bacteroidota bacterium]|nr:GDSL-type esterase/lipase family protein [Bacteroidota bacterium]